MTGSVVQAGTIQQVVLPPQARREDLPVPRQLPPAVRDFVDRSDEMAVFDAVLPVAENDPDAVVVAVVDGTGGVGKTTFVVQWAHRVQDRFPDGTLFVNLRGYGPSASLDPVVVLSSFLHALGVAEAQIPAELDALVGLYRSVLAGRRVLVVLDNAANAEQVRPLLPGAPGCVVVATSRGSLTGLVVAEAAHRLSLDVFTASEAEILLRGIVGADRVDAEPNAVGDLVRVCAGLPLAVRVAATRVAARPQLAIADVVEDITEDHEPGHGEALGSSGDVGGAVQSVFDWSYTQLLAEYALVFRRLGLHPGSEFGVHAAAAVAEVDLATVYRCLEALADLHLVEPVGRKRYRMHDLLHAYAAHRAETDEPPGGRREAVSRVLAWYARTAQHADRAAFSALAGMPGEVDPVGQEISFADRAQALAWLSTEHANLVAMVRCAAEGGLDELAMALAASGRFLTFREHAWSTLHIEATSLGVAAARVAGNQAVEALLLSMRGDTLRYLGRLDDAEADFASTLALADELDDRARQVSGLSGLGRVRLAQDRLHDARDYYQRALPLTRGLGSGRAEAVVHCNLSQICTRLGEFEQALDHAEQELVLRRQAGDQTGEAFALYDAAVARQGLGDHEAAIGLCRQAITAYRALGDIGGDLVLAILALASSLEHIGDRSGAAMSLRETVAVLTQLDDPRVEQTRQRLAALEAQIANDPHP